MDIGVINLFGETERLHSLPYEPIIGSDYRPLCSRDARKGRIASGPVQALEILVVVGQVHVCVGVAEIAVHRDVLDTRALQPEDLGGVKDAGRLGAQVARDDVARRIDDRLASGGLRLREDGVDG